jgi:hypothetical protein
VSACPSSTLDETHFLVEYETYGMSSLKQNLPIEYVNLFIGSTLKICIIHFLNHGTNDRADKISAI